MTINQFYTKQGNLNVPYSITTDSFLITRGVNHRGFTPFDGLQLQLDIIENNNVTITSYQSRTSNLQSHSYSSFVNFDLQNINIPTTQAAAANGYRILLKSTNHGILYIISLIY